jgi:urease accessory protein UreF
LEDILFYSFYTCLRLAKEEELVAARTKAEELEKENMEMGTKLAKKEQELDLRTQEKVIQIRFIYLFENV